MKRIVIPGEPEKRDEFLLSPKVWNVFFRKLFDEYRESENRRKVWELRASMPKDRRP